MPKNSDKGNMPAFALQFIGSLFFLAVVVALWGVAFAPNAWGNGLASGSFWATIFYAVGVVSAVSLLFTSFAQLGSMGGMAAWKAMKVTSMAGFSLAVLTVSNPMWLIVTLVGFVLASGGSAIAMKSWKEMKE